ncbi:uncharacterized protein LOC125046268 [Penaeus chinensis]|uniref:uncharacterized protein LOC125046268 n=1 Tax=Penaeus chinensis TaxID=139456 RepID=UPI001FB710B9|nr:uncharacterized protein LOC125046268 [Penaeus chinensis]
MCWTSEVEYLSPEEVSAVVAMEFLRAYLHAGLTRDVGCLSRSLCRANAAAAEWGDLAHALAHALSTAHAEWVAQVIPGGRDLVLHAASGGAREVSAEPGRLQPPLPLPRAPVEAADRRQDGHGEIRAAGSPDQRVLGLRCCLRLRIRLGE